MIDRSRFLGALLGLAAGDAVGTALEFKPPGTFAPVDDMVGGGPFQLRPGEWTDDTSMALCLAESLVESKGFDARDQMLRYVRWWREGHLSVKGRCFDIGNTVRAALGRFESTGQPFSGSTHPEAAANGSIMRLAPVPLLFASDIDEAIHYSAESSRTTHAAQRPIDACRYLGALIAAAARGTSKEELLDEGFWRWGPLHPEIEEIARGSFKRRSPPQIVGSGFVVRSLEAALWALHSSETFREGCLCAVNLGDDADTTGAVFGQLAGAIYGEEAIPSAWQAQLAMRVRISALAGAIHGLSQHTTRPRGPIRDSCWVSPHRLLAGEYPGAPKLADAKKKVETICAAGVDLFLDLTESGEYGLVPYSGLLDNFEDVQYERFPVQDLGCSTREEMTRILERIDLAIAKGRVTYVHCYGGIGRTGTVIGCWLVRHGRTGSAALNAIRRWRSETPDGTRPSPETDAQTQLVMDWR